IKAACGSFSSALLTP
ncbi:hypothetical protein VCHC17A2_3565B, partial [Vibrio cholerae HC-17A2]